MTVAPDGLAHLEPDARALVARYPQSRSALLPLLHLVQAEQGYVTPEGIEFCARVLDLTAAEVSAVVTFYTQYKRHPVGTYSVGVCTNTLCAVLGGDAIYSRLSEHLGVGHDETTADGVITLEHIECNAACDYAPVVMVNWEFFDDQTPDSAVALVDRLRAGDLPRPTRGAALRPFRETSRVLAGFYDGRAGEGPAAGPATLVGLRLARQRGEDAPAAQHPAPAPPEAPTGDGAPTTGYGPAGGPSGSDAGLRTAASDAANPAPAGAADESGSAAPDRTVEARTDARGTRSRRKGRR